MTETLPDVYMVAIIDVGCIWKEKKNVLLIFPLNITSLVRRVSVENSIRNHMLPRSHCLLIFPPDWLLVFWERLPKFQKLFFLPIIIGLNLSHVIYIPARSKILCVVNTWITQESQRVNESLGLFYKDPLPHHLTSFWVLDFSIQECCVHLCSFIHGIWASQ